MRPLACARLLVAAAVAVSIGGCSSLQKAAREDPVSDTQVATGGGTMSGTRSRFATASAAVALAAAVGEHRVATRAESARAGRAEL